MNGEGRRRDRFNSRRNQSKQKVRLNAEEVLEGRLGFDLFTEGEKRLGWLLTLAPVSNPCFHTILPLITALHFFQSLGYCINLVKELKNC